MLEKEITDIHTESSPDEAWWAAILADAEAQDESTPVVVAAPRRDPEPDDEKPIDWKWAEKLYKEDQIITLTVTGYNRGGLLVEDQRIQGFVPISHIIEISEETSDEERKAILAAYVGRELNLKVIECSPKRERVVLSERAALAAPGRRIELLKTLVPGARVRGRVTTITNFGVFIDLGGVEGLIHISELSWGRVGHPSEILDPSQDIEVHVLNLDKERCRVALSLKRLYPNPWEAATETYHPGDITQAVITNIVPYGAFARLNEGLDGLIHLSEMGETPQETVEKLNEGQKVRVSILHIDAENQQLGLRLQSLDGEEAR